MCAALVQTQFEKIHVHMFTSDKTIININMNMSINTYMIRRRSRAFSIGLNTAHIYASSDSYWYHIDMLINLYVFMFMYYSIVV